MLVFVLFGIKPTGYVKAQGGCVEIDRILVAACTSAVSPEGYNEMLYFRTGSNQLNTNTLQVTWPSSTQVNYFSWLGLVQDASTANKVNQLNATIQSCGFLKEPIGGVIPPNAKVLLITSQNISAQSNSFANLSDTIYVIFQNNSSQTGGHFLNASTSGYGGINGTSAMTTVIHFGGGCSDQVTYQRSNLVTTQGIPGSQPGATVVFDPAGNPTYINNGCQGAFNPFSAEWTNPGPLCSGVQAINLNTYITGTKGGKWTGQGILQDSIFDPNGLTGDISITYTVTNTGGCSKTLSKNIQIIPKPNAPKTDSLVKYCIGKPLPILKATTSAGTTVRWYSNSQLTTQVGTGLNYQTLAGQSILYAAAILGSCKSDPVKITLKALPGQNAKIKVKGSITDFCKNGNVTLYSDSIGNNFWAKTNNASIISNKDSLTINSAGKYILIRPGVCDTAFDVLDIADIPLLSAAWTPQNICAGSPSINLNKLITGNKGGKWTGQGITKDSLFDPTGLSGSIAITYTVNPSADCPAQKPATETKNIQVFNPQKPQGQNTYFICNPNETPTIQVTAGNGTTVKWFTDQQLNNQVASGNSYKPSQGQLTLYVASFQENCKSEPLKITVAVGTKQNANITVIGGDTNLCKSKTILLKSDSTGNNIWAKDNLTSIISTKDTIMVSTIGKYYLIRKGACDTAIAEQLIIGQPVNTNIDTDKDNVFVDSKVVFSIPLIPENNCEWFLDGVSFQMPGSGEIVYNKEGKYNYTLICSNLEGCADTAFKTIVVTDPNLLLIIPNVFNPNSDVSDNSVFKVKYNAVKTFVGIIYNRWGTKLYEWNDVNGFWDGSINGAKPIDGVYYYVITGSDLKDKPFNERGTVQIISTN